MEVLDRKPLAPGGIRTPDHPACSLVTILTELSRLRTSDMDSVM
jgi:hypothetical protein